jgi:hypothetical protein
MTLLGIPGSSLQWDGSLTKVCVLAAQLHRRALYSAQLIEDRKAYGLIYDGACSVAPMTESLLTEGRDIYTTSLYFPIHPCIRYITVMWLPRARSLGQRREDRLPAEPGYQRGREIEDVQERLIQFHPPTFEPMLG